jgi:hypothetical protein
MPAISLHSRASRKCGPATRSAIRRKR